MNSGFQADFVDVDVQNSKKKLNYECALTAEGAMLRM